jgi:hypothetical protein
MSREIRVGADVIDQFPIFGVDGYTKKSGETSFVSTVWKNGVVDSTAVAIAEIESSGEYRVEFVPDSVGFWMVEVLINYNKEIWNGEYDVRIGTVADLYEMLQRVLGLNHENIFIDNTEYDPNTQLVLARVRLFDSKAHCDAATDGGSETAGLIATYQLTTVWEGINRFQTFKQTR